MNKEGVTHPLVESRPTPTFCDVCNKIAFGILLQCKKCGLICHKQCQVKITFHCESDTQRTFTAGKNKELEEISLRSPDEQFDTIRRKLSHSQISSRIADYNKSVRNKLVMTLRNDFSFTGYIRVELELGRPITVREMADKRDDIFYLPKNTVKAIYLASSNTASQVIKALLQKFKITNDPRKFILCERIERGKRHDNHVTIRPMNENERPLFLTLLWGSAHSGHGFRLKDQMESEPVWCEFKEAELEIFLKMYSDEERRAIREIEENYQVRRFQIEKLLQSRGEPLR